MVCPEILDCVLILIPDHFLFLFATTEILYATEKMSENRVTEVEVIVIGAGISGVATLKCLLESGLKAVVLERTGEVGGLWTFREHDYGVMRFTHMYV